MKPVDLLAVAFIALLVVLAIWYANSHRDCSGDCASCHTKCATRDGEVPSFVKRYRKDHPKSSSTEKK